MTMKLSEARLAALMAARAGRLWKVGRVWKRRGGDRSFDERTVGPMVGAGLLVDLCGSREITEAGRRRLAETEERR